MNNFGKYLQKEKYIFAILRGLRAQGWICPEYEQRRRTKGGYKISEFFGTIAQKGEWSFVLWNHSPYAKEFTVPRGRSWGLFHKSRLIDSGRNLKPPERVVSRVTKLEGLPVWKLVAKVLSQ